MRPRLENALASAAEVLDAFRADDTALAALSDSAAAVRTVLSAGGKILVCGNGGSHAEAAHFAEEWTGRFRSDRPPLPVIALGEASHITCVANDFGFEQVFARQVQALGVHGDALVVLSTSGSSQNLLAAAHEAKRKGMVVLGFLGRDGGRLRELCDVALLAPGETSDRIQEIHLLALHALIEAVEHELGYGG